MPLNLSRRAGEQIVIAHGGASLVLTLTGMRNGKAYFAFDAPQEFRIDRKEVADRKAGWQSEPGPEEAAELRDLSTSPTTGEVKGAF